MKNSIVIFLAILLIAAQGCRTTKQINKVIATKDTTAAVMPGVSGADSVKFIRETMTSLRSHYIDYTTFNAKIKAEYEDNKGKKPDVLAVVRIVKDSAIWISLSASILNVE